MCTAYLDDVGARWIFTRNSANINLAFMSRPSHWRMHSAGYSSLQTSSCGTCNVHKSEWWHICQVFSQWQHQSYFMPDRTVVCSFCTHCDIYSGMTGCRVRWCCHIAASCHISPHCGCCCKDHNVTFPSCSRCFKASFCSTLDFTLPQGISILRHGAIQPLKPFSFFPYPFFLKIYEIMSRFYFIFYFKRN